MAGDISGLRPLTKGLNRTSFLGVGARNSSRPAVARGQFLSRSDPKTGPMFGRVRGSTRSLGWSRQINPPKFLFPTLVLTRLSCAREVRSGLYETNPPAFSTTHSVDCDFVSCAWSRWKYQTLQLGAAASAVRRSIFRFSQCPLFQYRLVER